MGNPLPIQGEGEQKQEQRRIYLVTDGLKSPQTKRVYNSAFNKFIEHVQNPHLQTLIDTKTQIIEAKIISYIEYLRDVRKLSCSTILCHYSSIQHFFEINDVQLNLRKIKKFLPSEENVSYICDRPYSIPEIQQILDRCDMRERVIILLLTSTGMRVGAIPGLRISDIKKMDEFNLYLINVYANSRRCRYYSFCTPECAKAIDDYLAYRKRLGEEIKDSNPLVRNHISIDNPFTAKTARPIGVRAIQLIVKDLLNETGLVYDKRQVMSTHGFRKFFITNLDRAGVMWSTREFLSGHKLPGQDASYVRATEEDRFLEYVKALDLLTISSESKLRQQIKNKENDINFIYEEISSLKRCVKHMTAQMKSMGYNYQQTQEVEKSYDECTDIWNEYADKVTNFVDSDSTRPTSRSRLSCST
jgi:integrase